ncbi:ATP-grasp peptide maturase system methyltransferase [Plantactinospora sp. S1510]|uniref:Protein-L-isoaspartate O-methyltransferase n=1 Tax=Plantactinospora alkalitolerans TaxID=2789879 RepID=A0ABS0HAT1_9ACTN|nr:ATP-grasp peptide maturase system methyltransferase [Plantactinospora alkalitolerans]MBF9135222.1 ATP-grasp peptide maturase system methyltransferase [Plantactinospora alkalitolerans]
MTLTLDHEELRQRLVARIRHSGHLTNPRVAAAFAAVPRHVFAPAAYHVDEAGQVGDVLRGDRPEQRAAYLEAVYSDNAIVTQVTADGRVTSSSTQPGVMAVMLEALDLAGNERVLEIGTGSGYNAALLCALVGETNVTTVDIDRDLVNQAITALGAADYRPAAIAADGLTGHPRRAPYDRIIATCSVRRVPAAWLRQTRPGGIVLANLSYGVVPLRVDDNGNGIGRFLPQVAAFIEARPADGPLGPSVDEIVRTCMEGRGADSAADVRAVELFTDPNCEFFWHLAQPDVYQCGPLLDGGEVHCLVDGATGSWARVRHHGDEVTVTQGGGRRMWDEVAAWCLRWDQAGRPGHNRLGLTVTPEGRQTVWVDTPTGRWRWDLA